jgi:hypothetical protein
MQKRMEGEFSPALAVASSHDYVGGNVGGSSLGLCLRDEILSFPWMACSNLIERCSSCKNGCKK